MNNKILNPFEPVNEGECYDIFCLRDGRSANYGNSITVDTEENYRCQIFLTKDIRCDLIVPKGQKQTPSILKDRDEQYKCKLLFIKNVRIIGDRELLLEETSSCQTFQLIDEFCWTLPGSTSFLKLNKVSFLRWTYSFDCRTTSGWR